MVPLRRLVVWLLCTASLLAAARANRRTGQQPSRQIRHTGARKPALALMAVMTAFDTKYQERRQHARQTWFPASQMEMNRLYQETGIEIRFTIGVTPPAYQKQIAAEEEKYGAFLHIPVKDNYNTLSYKTVALWELVSERYDVRYIIKVDDDNYVRMDRLAFAIKQWQDLGAEYIGCFKIRDDKDKRLSQRTHRWYDPHHQVFVGDDSRYAEGPFYVVPGPFINTLVRSGLVPRMGGPEDLMTGWIMKGFNVTFYDDRRLCYSKGCNEAMVAFKWDHSVRDFLDPAKRFETVCCVYPDGPECKDPARAHAEGLECMHIVHGDSTCNSSTLTAQNELPMFSYYDMAVDQAWIADNLKDMRGSRVLGMAF